ncbi:DUF6893 family small protein [Streptomyces sp. NBC_00996]|jgi:hypothetical protein
MIKTLVVGTLAAAVAVVVVQSLPDIRRYLRMRCM